MNPKNQKLVEVLREAWQSLSRSDNDFTWSSWENAQAAIHEIAEIISRIESDDMPKRSDLEILFAPTGSIQEISIRSGWGQEFLTLAYRFDQAVALSYG